MPVEIDIPSIYLSTIVKDIIRVMTGLELHEIKTFSENYDSVTEEITALLIMAGEQNVMLSLGMSKSTAVTLAVYMTGIANKQLKDTELNDCTAELVNMMGGQLKTQLAGIGQHYKLLSPIVVAGNNYYIIHKDKIERKSKRFKAGSIDLIFEVYCYNS